MADQSDVETALAAAVAAALYPNGTAALPTVAATCRIYRGYPAPQALDADLVAGIVNVTVFAAPHPPQDTTRYPATWRVPAVILPSLTATVLGTTVSFDGTPAPNQIAGVAVDGRSFSYAVQSTDSTALVAASLAVPMRAAGVRVQVSGASLTCPGAGHVVARIVQNQAAIRETRRQRQEFGVTCWCPAPMLRDQVAAAIDSALAAIAFLTLADGTGGRLTHAGGSTTDQQETASLYRRDLVYAVDYPTTEPATLPSMLFGIGTLGSPAGAMAPLLG
jgi:hypothetical protein